MIIKGTNVGEKIVWTLTIACIIISILSLIIGCNTPFIPTPPPEPIHVRIPAKTDYKAVLAWEIARVVDVPIPSPHPKPEPVPNPTPSPDGRIKIGDDCPPPCDNGWTFGDGNHKQVCWKCNGDGRADEGDPILDPNNQDIGREEPTLAPLPEIKMIAPITIHVEKSVAKESGETVYSIEKDGMVCTWDSIKNCFVCPDGEEIEVQNITDISTVKEITINYGDYFRRFSVREQHHDNSRREAPSNGSSGE